MENFRHGRSCFMPLVLVQFLFIQSHGFFWMAPSSRCESSPAAATWDGPAPELPILPLQYSMKVEANILQRSKSVEVEEHYDSINQRASVSITRNGSTIVSIFNFNTSQRYDIYPNGTCEARPSSIDYLGFVRKDKQNKPVMAPVNDVFHFGTRFNMTYIGRENVRGINVNHWSSCQNWTQFGANFQLDYYFSEPNFTTATGLTEIPIRAVLNGSYSAPGNPQGQSQGKRTFQHSYEFTSFRAGPVLNDEVFHIPPGIMCSGRTDNKPLPSIPDQLEMSMEVLIPVGKHKIPREEYLVYDFDHKLVETLMTMVTTEFMDMMKVHKGQVKADNDNLIAITGSVVRDYNSGIAYITERLNMTCAIRKMPSSLSATTMAHGQNLFAVANGTNQFTYQGQSRVRHMLVDMWAMEQGGISTELYFLPVVGMHPFQPMVGMFIKNHTSVGEIDMPKIFKEIFQSEGNPWDESDDKDFQASSSPGPNSQAPKPQTITGDQLAWGLQLERMLDQYTPHKVVNIFHYSPLHLDTYNFQVSQCYQEQEISEVMLVIMADYYKDVLPNYVGFSNSLRNSLAQRVGVSLLHISNLAPTPYKLEDPKKDATKVTFTLLGAAPVQGIEQKSIIQAKNDLLKAISNGITFHVQYPSYSKDFMVHKSLYVLDCCNNINPDDRVLVNGLEANVGETTKSDSIKYSPGSVAGIAIGTLCLGAVLSLGVLFLLYRWKRPGEPLVPYKHSTC